MIWQEEVYNIVYLFNLQDGHRVIHLIYFRVDLKKKRKHNSQGILDVNKIMILTCIVILFLEFAWAKHKIGKRYIHSNQKMLNYLSRILIILIVEIIV